MLKIYNTLTREKEKFKPLALDQTKVYFCGPTVYNYAHIWNLRTFIFEDYVVRGLSFLGFKPKVTMNITDIDDKTIRDSILAWEKLEDFTKKYTEIFLKDLKKLNIKTPDNITPISSIIDEMVEMINWLIKNWYAYLWEDNSIYYDIKKFKNYWKLANLDFKWMQIWKSVDNDEYTKENLADFVLWKAYKETDWDNFWEEKFIFWDEEKILKWRPGWHIECSACNKKHFWGQIDLHMWWIDLVFPHHQNEIAQSEGYFKKTFSNYWMHGGHLFVDGKKMSKSLNNFYTLAYLEEKYFDISKDILYRAIRLSFMMSKYRESVDFSFEKLESNFVVIKKIDNTIKKLLAYKKNNNLEHKFRRELREDLQWIIWDFVSSLEDDFNMPEVFSVFFEYITFVNSLVDENNLSIWETNSLIEMFWNFNEVLAIIDFDLEEEFDDDILNLFNERNLAKKDKNFDLADKLRDELLEKWYKIVDDRAWSRLEKK